MRDEVHDLAAEEDQADVARVLLQLRADPHAKQQDGQSALHIAASSNSPDVVPIICEDAGKLGLVDAVVPITGDEACPFPLPARPSCSCVLSC